jgi:hypothetical protein
MSVTTTMGGTELVAKLPSTSRARPGDRLPLWADLTHIHVFDPATEVALAHGRGQLELLH